MQNNIFVLLGFLLTFQTSLLAQADFINLTGELSSCEQDSLYFFQLDGNQVKVLGLLPLQEGENAKLLNINLPKETEPGFYFIGGGRPVNSRIFLLTGEPIIHFSGECPTLSKSTVQSPANMALENSQQTYLQLNQETNNLLSQSRRLISLRQPTQGLDSSFLALDNRKLAFIQELEASFPYVAKIIKLQTYLSFQGFGKNLAPDEASYFANRFFQLTDLSDPFLASSPYLHDSFNNYAQTLGRVGLPPDTMSAVVNGHLRKVSQGSRKGLKTSLLGLVGGFQRSNEEMFVRMGDRYLEEFGDDNPAFSQQLERQLAPIKSRTIGNQAPEISLPTPEGDTLSLSSLQGSYVLVDFWASWCGPCRKENPRVKQVYEKYKDKGFDILGVSLDRSKSSWVNAINHDQLPWKHVSDLKYWSSIAAQTYGVHSIPYTVLLDKDGKIIAKNLRGANLDAKLAEIFGE